MKRNQTNRNLSTKVELLQTPFIGVRANSTEATFYFDLKQGWGNDLTEAKKDLAAAAKNQNDQLIEQMIKAFSWRFGGMSELNFSKNGILVDDDKIVWPLTILTKSSSDDLSFYELDDWPGTLVKLQSAYTKNNFDQAAKKLQTVAKKSKGKTVEVISTENGLNVSVRGDGYETDMSYKYDPMEKNGTWIGTYNDTDDIGGPLIYEPMSLQEFTTACIEVLQFIE